MPITPDLITTVRHSRRPTPPPSVYIEKFEGTPNAQSGDVYCPQENQYYPDVQDCPNGWQRVIRPAEEAPRSG